MSNTLINSKIESYILKILSKDIEIDTSSIKDGYVFELYYNYALIKKKNGGDEDFNSIIKVLKPLIKNEGIQCCEFFIMFDSIDK